jgi:hypothetical protein
LTIWFASVDPPSAIQYVLDWKSVVIPSADCVTRATTWRITMTIR